MTTNVLVIGLGRVGLPQALVLAESGHNVFGYDTDKSVITLLREKRVPFDEPGLAHLIENFTQKRFFPVEDFSEALPSIDAVIFTLGTTVPDSETCLNDDDLDLDGIKSSLMQVLKPNVMKRGFVIIFRATLPLGGTDRIREFIREKMGLTEGSDYFLGFVPERLAEGKAVEEEKMLPKIIGAYSKEGQDRIRELFGTLGSPVLIVSNPRTAEFCKLADNSFRNTMFAFSNELALQSTLNGLDIMEVIQTINTEYPRNNIPRPGFVSGYCLGKDPYIFEYRFREVSRARGFHSLWYYGRRVNDYLVDHVAEKMYKALSGSKTISEKKILVLGMSFKDDIDDFRMSHSELVFRNLVNYGFKQFNIYDPNLDKNKYTRIPEDLRPFVREKSRILEDILFAGIDAILVTHRHSEILGLNEKKQLQRILSFTAKPLYIFDAWNILREAADMPGISYESLGYMGKS